MQVNGIFAGNYVGDGGAGRGGFLGSGGFCFGLLGRHGDLV